MCYTYAPGPKGYRSLYEVHRLRTNLVTSWPFPSLKYFMASSRSSRVRASLPRFDRWGRRPGPGRAFFFLLSPSRMI